MSNRPNIYNPANQIGSIVNCGLWLLYWNQGAHTTQLDARYSRLQNWLPLHRVVFIRW
jgi:hypothetical protein